MTQNLKKYGLMIIAAVMLVALAFAGAASAKDIANPGDYLTVFEQESLDSEETYYFKDTWPIVPVHLGLDPLIISENVTLDFTGFTGSFIGIPSPVDRDAYSGGLFGNVQIKDGKTLEIIGLNMSNVVVNLLDEEGFGVFELVGGIIGAVSPTDGMQGTLKFTNCHLDNCLIAGSAAVGGLLGAVRLQETQTMETNVIVEDCSVVHCDIHGLSEWVGGLIGSGQEAKEITVTRSVVANCAIHNDGIMGGNLGGLIGWSPNNIVLNDNTVENTVIVGGPSNVGGLIGHFGGSDSSSINGCTVKNCVVVGLGMNSMRIGSIVGLQEGNVGISNFRVTNTTLSGRMSTGGVMGQKGNPQFSGKSLVKFCAVDKGELIIGSDAQYHPPEIDADLDYNFLSKPFPMPDTITMYDSDNNEISPDEEDFWCKVAYVKGQSSAKFGGDDVIVTSVGKYGTPDGYGIVVTDPEPVVYITTATRYMPLLATPAHNDVTVDVDDGAKSGSAVLHYDGPGKYTLTLNGFTVDTRGSKYKYFPIIDSRVPDLTIVVNGESKLSAAIPSQYQNTPTVIYAEGDLTVKGADPQNDRLTVVNTGAVYTHAHAIGVEKTLTISSVTVDATAKTTADNPDANLDASAIRSYNGDIIITHAGVMATADVKYGSPSEKGHAYSICASQNLKISSSDVKATATGTKSATSLESMNAGIEIRDCGEIVAVGTLSSFILPDLSNLNVRALKTGYEFANATSVGGPYSYTDFVNPKNWWTFKPTEESPQFKASVFKAVKISKIVPIIIDIDGVEQSLTILYGSSRLDVTAPTKRGCTFAGWFTSGGEMVAEPDGTLVKGVAGYTSDAGTWIRAEATTLYAQWIVERGHSPSLPKDYTPSGYVEPMVQETVQPTAAPTPAAPTVMPTSKPTTQQTQKSPAPLAGLIAGLGAAALLIRMRR